MIFGWDISTSIIGVSFFTADGYVGSDYLDLRKMDSEPIDKAEAANVWIGKFSKAAAADKQYDHVHYIEDKLSNFAAGRTMQQTLLKLAAFNATISYIIWKSFNAQGLGGYIDHIHPSTVKAIMKREGLIIPKGSKEKKALTLDFVSKKEPLFPLHLNKNGNPQPYCYDMADSYIVARAGHLRTCSERKNSEP